MANLTQEGQNILARIYSREDITNTVQSKILEAPKFIEQKDNLTYTSDIENYLGISKCGILDIIDYEDYKVVFGNYIDGQGDDAIGVGYVGIFSVNDDSLLYAFNETEELTSNELLKPFNYVAISKTGSIVGLQNYGSTVHFFRFTSFLDDLQDFIDGSDTIFFDANFDISTVITTEEDGTSLDIPLGNARFLDYEKIGFNQDSISQDTFAFVLWSSSDKKIKFIRFSIDASEINSIRNVDFSFNEDVSLAQGITGAGENFNGITVVDVLTGEQSDGKKSSIGSIAFSVQQDAGQSQTLTKITSITSTSPRHYSDSIQTAEFVEFKIADKTTFFDAWLSKIQKIIDSGATIVETGANGKKTGGTITVASKYNGGEDIDIPIDKATIDAMLAANNIEIIERESGPTQLTLNYILKIDNNEKIIKTYSISEKIGVTIYGNTSYEYRKIFGSISDWRVSISTDITENINVVYEITQATVKSNTTSQIIIEQDKDGNTYNIVQSENNSFNGNAPVFLSPRKFYIPLKEKNSQYSIFEFNGNGQDISIDKFNNFIAQQNGTSIIQLVTPDSITKITINGIKLDSSRYTLDKTTGQVQITNLTTNDSGIVQYKSLIGSPKKVNIATSTTTDDLFINSVSSINEVESNVPSIIGAGDTFDDNAGLPKEVFAINLYRANSPDFDAIAEDIQDIEFKIAHVRGYRQKDLLWIEAYNADFSSYVKWVQIYPESFKPYTYLPYRNTLLELELDRLNSSIDQKLNLSAFDRSLLNISTSNNITIATTVAETTDLNGANNSILLFGQTNQGIIEEKRTISKTRNISTEININITTTFVDRSGDSEIIRNEPSNEMAKLFNPNEKENREKNNIDNYKLFATDGTLLASGSASQHLSRVDNSVFFKADFVDANNLGKELGTLEIYNGINQLLSSEELSQCDGILSYEKEFRFTDEISEIPYLTWGKTPWDTKPWQPTTNAKGGK